VDVRVEAATARNLGIIVLKGTVCIHYTGHGMPEFLAFEVS